MKRIIPTSSRLAFALAAGALLAGCSFQTYHPQPIDPVQSARHYRAHDPQSAEFREYMIAQGYPAEALPVKQWGPRELVLSALFFHPQLDVARAQLQATRAHEITAAQQPNPNVSASFGRSEDDAYPWVYNLGIDLPLQTAGKGEISIAQAQALSAAALIEIGQTAWSVRSRLLGSWIEYDAARQQLQILQQERDLQQAVVAMLSARLEAGMISSVELGAARLQLQQAEQAVAAVRGQLPGLRATLASNAGLSTATFDRLELQSSHFDALVAREHELPLTLHDADLQDAALLNRLDIRAALALYDAAEQQLRLEIARQYPDLTLSPSYYYEEGFHVWSLGLSALLPLLDRNEGPIAEARAQRAVQAAEFDALQTRVIAEIEQAQARYRGALDELEQVRHIETSQQAYLQQMTQQFENGYADRLELTTARLESLLAKKNLLTAEYNVQRAAAALEDVLQQPLEHLPALPADMEQAVRPAGQPHSSTDPSQ